MKILIGYDGSESADAALADLRRAGLPREAQALVVSVSDTLMTPPPSSYEIVEQALASRRVRACVMLAQVQTVRVLKEAEEFISKASGQIRSNFPGWEVRAEAVAGKPSAELIRRAYDWKADLVVVGAQGRSALGRLFLGSVSKTVSAEARCSVRVARRGFAKGADAPLRVILGVDGSPGAEQAAREVGRRVWPDGIEARIIAVDGGVAPARLAHVLPTAAAMIRRGNDEAALRARAMAEWAADELRAIGLNVSVEMKRGDPQRVLLEEAQKWEADSIFVGARGLDSLHNQSGVGSTATALLTLATCSVEVVR
jgi:nucleotide-binding universal stress UspA family protein